MSSQAIARVEASALQEFALQTLRAIGLVEQQCLDTSEAMVWGDLRGLRGHGVIHRLRQCVGRIRAGGTNPLATIRTVTENGTLALFDADNAWGQAAATAATRWAVEKATHSGLALATIRNTGTPAALGYYADIATRQGLIGLALTNCPALVAAPGGVEKILGNQAHGFGIPSRSNPPVIFDSALTLMSTTEMDRRLADDESLPEGVLLTNTGDPTTNPADWLDGILLPIGAHRGFGLALVFEFLTSALAASDRPSFDVTPPYSLAEPQGVSFTFIAINPAMLGPLEEFERRVDRIIDAVHESGSTSGGDSPRVPGERQAHIYSERLEHGIPITGAELEDLNDLADSAGVARLRK